MTNEYEEKLIANFNNFILRDDLEEILKSTKKKRRNHNSKTMQINLARSHQTSR